MGIGSITSANGMPAAQVSTSNLKDQKSKNIQSKITNARQQIQKLSSEEDLSVNEKTTEKKKLQKEISSLNTKLKQHQEELGRSQKREIRMAELLEDKKPAKEEQTDDNIRAEERSSDVADGKNLPDNKRQTTRPETVITQNSDGTVILKETASQDKRDDVKTENKQETTPKAQTVNEEKTKTIDKDTVTDTGFSAKEMNAMVSADSSLQRAGRQGTIIARISDGIAILKDEINQDKDRGINTERKQTELEKMQKRKERAIELQSSILGEANDSMKSLAEKNKKTDKDKKTDTTDNTFSVSGLNIPQEEQASLQKFHVAFS